MTVDNRSPHWDEETSERFIDYGKYFVPARERQMHIMVSLLYGIPRPAEVLELCCGEGLLAEQILQSFPDLRYTGLDGSPMMLEKAAHRLQPFTNRIHLSGFELAQPSWRVLEKPIQAVVSSLAIHHLLGEEKRLLYEDVFHLLDMGGVLIIADMIEPRTATGRQAAADEWDEVVRQRSINLDSNIVAFDFFSSEHWNTFRYPDSEDIDHPSPIFDQLEWLEEAGFVDIDVHFVQAGHALFSGWKRDPDFNNGLEEM